VQVLADLDEAEQLVSDAQCRLSGRIRLALPLGFGVSQLAAPIGDFLDANPKISIDVDLNDRQVDLVEENVDLAIRVGDLEDSSLVARRLASVRFVTCASPAYLEKNGVPRHPGELAEHEVLRYSNVAAARQWCFRQGNKTITARVRHRLSANNGEFLAIVATRGVGIVSGPLSLLQAQIDSGELLPILDQFTREEAGMYAVYPPGRLISRRVKIFSDALRDYFRGRSI
jgi:DNA-binding transcriptional LysR family regulator